MRPTSPHRDAADRRRFGPFRPTVRGCGLGVARAALRLVTEGRRGRRARRRGGRGEWTRPQMSLAQSASSPATELPGCVAGGGGGGSSIRTSPDEPGNQVAGLLAPAPLGAVKEPEGCGPPASEGVARSNPPATAGRQPLAAAAFTAQHPRKPPRRGPPPPRLQWIPVGSVSSARTPRTSCSARWSSYLSCSSFWRVPPTRRPTSGRTSSVGGHGVSNRRRSWWRRASSRPARSSPATRCSPTASSTGCWSACIPAGAPC